MGVAATLPELSQWTLLFGFGMCGLLFFGGSNLKLVIFLSRLKMTSNEHPYPNLCRVPPMGLGID